ncbi:hypothetical protein [Streptomyces sp900116325]|uniref:hypothetical protein n=1 Tax=Streptomyces sp. 900116325 TaxID=3154295 RepID=UPI0033C9FD71
MATQIVPAPVRANHQGTTLADSRAGGACSARTPRSMRTPTGDYLTCAGGHAVDDPHGAGFGRAGWFTWTDDQAMSAADRLAHEAASYVRSTPEVQRAVARFRSAALTVASYEAMDSADMTPDEHNAWYDKLNVMRDARATLATAGQLHLIEPAA